MNWLVLARALHVVSVVLWIGGVGFATSVLLPGISASVAAQQRFASFRAFESRFVWIARALVVIVGASGSICWLDCISAQQWCCPDTGGFTP